MFCIYHLHLTDHPCFFYFAIAFLAIVPTFRASLLPADKCFGRRFLPCRSPQRKTKRKTKSAAARAVVRVRRQLVRVQGVATARTHATAIASGGAKTRTRTMTSVLRAKRQRRRKSSRCSRSRKSCLATATSRIRSAIRTCRKRSFGRRRSNAISPKALIRAR